MFMTDTQDDHPIDPLIQRLEADLIKIGKRKSWLCGQLKIKTQTYNNWRVRSIPYPYRITIAKIMGWPLDVVLSDSIKEDAGTYALVDKKHDIQEKITTLLTGHLREHFEQMSTSGKIPIVIHLFEYLQDDSLRAVITGLSKPTLYKLLGIDD